jgi:uncharacterized membrane protein
MGYILATGAEHGAGDNRTRQHDNMNTLGKLFLQGLAVTIPVALTLAITWWLAAGAEHLLGGMLMVILPQGWYIPGMGLVAGIALTLLVGVLSHVIIFQRLFDWGEALLNRLPLVKTIYTALKDFIAYLRPGTQGQFSRVVLVRLGGSEQQLLGFVTREQLADLSLPTGLDEPIAVYLPMSYMIGGYTLFLPRSSVTPVDMPFEQAMRLTLTGGVTRYQGAAADERTSDPA